ncbi:urease accessory protein UreH domain-containing protein [[Eubacterium] cellulosolvens]
MPLILGIARGSSICLIACAPGIVPYLVSKQYGWRKSLQLAILFNLPRIILLSILGIIVGILGFALKGWIISALPQIFLPIQTIGYGLLGIFILIFGAYMFTTSIEAHEDLKEAKERAKKNNTDKEVTTGQAKTTKTTGSMGKMDLKSNSSNDKINMVCSDAGCATQKPRIFSFIKRKFNFVQNKPERLFLLWGGILSIACLGEIILIELSVISGSFGLISNSMFEAALLGGASMFLFAIGASIPIIIVALVANPLGKFIRARGMLENIRTIFGIVMIMVGLGFVFILISFLANAL